MKARVIPAIGINLARRYKLVLLAQFNYAVRGLLFCCGVLFAVLRFFGADGAFESLPLELFFQHLFALNLFPRGSLRSQFLKIAKNLLFFLIFA